MKTGRGQPADLAPLQIAAPPATIDKTMRASGPKIVEATMPTSTNAPQRYNVVREEGTGCLSASILGTLGEPEGP